MADTSISSPGRPSPGRPSALLTRGRAHTSSSSTEGPGFLNLLQSIEWGQAHACSTVCESKSTLKNWRKPIAGVKGVSGKAKCVGRGVRWVGFLSFCETTTVICVFLLFHFFLFFLCAKSLNVPMWTTVSLSLYLPNPERSDLAWTQSHSTPIVSLLWTFLPPAKNFRRARASLTIQSALPPSSLRARMTPGIERTAEIRIPMGSYL